MTHIATIDGNQSGSCVVMARNARVDGFALQNGAGVLVGANRYGGALYCTNLEASGTIANSKISGNTADWGGGVYCEGSSPVIEDNAIESNTASEGGGGISCYYSSPTVTGNTIRGNTAYRGGGIYCDESSPTVTGNTISGNTAYGGGGIYCYDHSSPTVTGNTMTGNSAHGWGGGGIYCHGSSPTVTGNTMTGNSTDGGGGGIYWIYCDDSSPTVTGNTITGNTAYGGGGIYCYDSSPTVAGNTITGNTASYCGGGIYCDESSPTVAGNTITGNTASYCGGGIYCYDSSPTVTGNTITGNSAYERGGGIYCHFYSSPTVTGNTISGNVAYEGGGIHCDWFSSPTVAGNTITGNSADSGGGVYCHGSSPVIQDNAIESNAADSGGGGMYCYYGSSPTVTGNTITGNSASEGGGIYCRYYSSPTVTGNTITDNSAAAGRGLACDSDNQGSPSDVMLTNSILWDGGDEIWNNDGSTITVTYSDVQGGWPGEGNIDADPMFADPDSGDWHLTSGSPCIDVGTNEAPGLPQTDWEGDERIINGTVDMGADEYVTYYAEAPDPEPECSGPLFGGSQAGFPAWVWFSIPLTPDCVVGSGCADPSALLGFDCKGKLWYWDRYGKFAQVYRPPFLQWDLAVGNSYLLRLTDPVANPSYEGLSPFIPWEFEFRLGRQGWTWVGMPGLTELAGDDFMASVRVQYPSDDTGDNRTARQDHDAIPDNWITWGWPFYDTYLQAPKTFTPYAPFGNTTCYPWIGYRCWVKVGAAQSPDDPDQVTLIWPKSQ